MKYILLLLILTMTQISIAQTDEFGEPWPISSECVSLQPWNAQGREFEGTIIMTSRLNHLHAFRDEWETPHIVARLPNVLQPREISPDARWYAVVEGMGTSNPEAWLTTVESNAIHVYNTLDGKSFTIPWEDNYLAASYPTRLFWIDNEHILYSLRSDLPSGIWYVINPFSGEVSEWNSPFTPGGYPIFYLSPDTVKGFAADEHLHQWSILNGDEVTTFGGSTYYAAWHPSSDFLATLNYQVQETSTSTNVLILNLEGDVEHLIYQVMGHVDSSKSRIQLDVWSSDGRYLAFRHETLMIADLNTQQVWDTCMEVESLAWSYDSKQLAVTTDTGTEDLIRIIDLPTRSSYIVGIPSGPIIGWRADDEE